MLSSNEIRAKFLKFFEERDHRVLASSSLVPGNDPSLLFTNAGMVQFKDVFLGLDKREYVRAATSQRCVRAGGKHNDLENVGYTARHHTFFEMLGNFSFGDYFKENAILYAWEFLTDIVKLPKEKLWVTVYEEDNEAADIWLKKIGVPANRITRKGKKDNFWQMGDTGPCGPCSEIFYDHGPDVAGGPPGSADEDGDRYIEIWNLVFMQFNRSADGVLTPLPKPSVDTGMGLERLAAVLQYVHSNYEIDLFKNIITAAAKITGCKDLENKSLRVIADHIRSCAFLVVDGVIPSNEGRGYVLRRIIRRAIRHGYQLGKIQPFFYALVEPLANEMGIAYPELNKNKDRIALVLKKEEERFAETLEQGMTILDSEINKLKGKPLSGEIIFKLYDTYGFPADLTADIAREKNIALDMDGFEREMQAQRERARASSKFEMNAQHTIDVTTKTEFTGYDFVEFNSKIIALGEQNGASQTLATNTKGFVVLENTPFYAESGGQVGDRGEIIGDGFVFTVEDTQKQGDVFLHLGQVQKGIIKVGAAVSAKVNQALRQATVLHHSATHLMHAALVEVLGEHVQQKGSLVNEHHLRFDFSHFEPVNREQLLQIEKIVNREIRINGAASTELMHIDDAKKSGAMALFGEKYSDKVRVLSIGNYSKELCGGTHVSRAGDIGIFKITAEYGVAAGVRRIEAVAGDIALAYINDIDETLGKIAANLKANRNNADEKVQQLLDRNRLLEREMEQLKAKLASSSGSDLISKAVEIHGVKVLAAKVDGVDDKSLRGLVDQLKDQLGTAAIVLATTEGNKVSLIAGVSKDITSKIKAGDLVNSVAMQVGGKGGGRPDMAQAGGDNPAALDAALKSVQEWARKALA